MSEVTQSKLKELLSYSPATGVFVWKLRIGKATVGLEAGCIASDGYVVIRIDRKGYKAHRLAWLYVHGNFPCHQIDHIDGIRTNNRIVNLRDVSQLENQRNRRMNSNNKSGVTGVCWDKKDKKWTANIKKENKTVHLGRFDEFQDAIEARKGAERELGFHTNHGKRNKEIE